MSSSLGNEMGSFWDEIIGYSVERMGNRMEMESSHQNLSQISHNAERCENMNQAPERKNIQKESLTWCLPCGEDVRVLCSPYRNEFQLLQRNQREWRWLIRKMQKTLPTMTQKFLEWCSEMSPGISTQLEGTHSVMVAIGKGRCHLIQGVVRQCDHQAQARIHRCVLCGSQVGWWEAQVSL